MKASTVGDMFWADHPEPQKPLYDSAYTDCPICGGRMKKKAEMCRECWDEFRKKRWAVINVSDMLDRHRRIRLAVESGHWTFEELMTLAAGEETDLPTWEEIAEAAPRLMIQYWCERNGVGV